MVEYQSGGTCKFLTSTSDYAGTQTPRKVEPTPQPCAEGRSTREEVQEGLATILCKVSWAPAEQRPGFSSGARERPRELCPLSGGGPGGSTI